MLAPYSGPGLLPHEQTHWIDELTVGTERMSEIALTAGDQESTDEVTGC